MTYKVSDAANTPEKRKRLAEQNRKRDEAAHRVISEWLHFYAMKGKPASLKFIRDVTMTDAERYVEEMGGTMDEAIQKKWNI